ncbi:hypothetical protein [Acidocella sp.]|uniref:hypothetical protein n=1 Tax=Acidocella sp. TaxID=50710 RepID=UPI00262EEB1D|nr:hypothetical protein [Acidocella sp.]
MTNEDKYNAQPLAVRAPAKKTAAKKSAVKKAAAAKKPAAPRKTTPPAPIEAAVLPEEAVDIMSPTLDSIN